MIGFWDYTVILTYISLVSAVSGIFCALSSHIEYAVFFLALSGFCDMFDGKIAGTMLWSLSIGGDTQFFLIVV